MTDPDTLSPLEIIAILRHLRWGYARHSLMWLIVGAGLIYLEPRAALFGDMFVWICSWAAWGAILWAILHFGTAMFHSDKWLLDNFKRQTSLRAMKKELSKPSLSEDGATTLSFGEPAASLNQRLDEMGPYYRAIFGRLTQVLAIVENAASKNV